MHKKTPVLILAALLAGGVAPAADQIPAGHNRIEAVANSRVILRSDLDAYEAEYLKKMRAHLSPEQIPDRKTVRKQALDQLINTSLVEQLGEKMGVTISDVQLDQMMETAARMNGTTVQKMYEESFRREGLTPAQTREKFRREALISELQSISVRKRIKISNQEIDRMVEMLKAEGGHETFYHVAGIFLKITSSMSPQEMDAVEKQAEDLVRRIRAGENFAKLAARYSQDEKAADGGDWGTVNIHSLPTIFADNVVNTKPGDIVGPVRGDAGFLIIKVIDVKGARFQPDVKVHLRHILIKPTVILSDARVTDQLEKIRSRVLSGESDFATEARKYSEDPASAVEGGDLGLVNPEIFDPLFAQNIKPLGAGEISAPFRSSYGWHIAQMLEKKTDPNSNSALKDQAFQLLFSKRYNEELIMWLNELRNDSYIKITDPELSGQAQAQNQE